MMNGAAYSLQSNTELHVLKALKWHLQENIVIPIRKAGMFAFAAIHPYLTPPLSSTADPVGQVLPNRLRRMPSDTNRTDRME